MRKRYIAIIICGGLFLFLVGTLTTLKTDATPALSPENVTVVTQVPCPGIDVMTNDVTCKVIDGYLIIQVTSNEKQGYADNVGMAQVLTGALFAEVDKSIPDGISRVAINVSIPLNGQQVDFTHAEYTLGTLDFSQPTGTDLGWSRWNNTWIRASM